MGVWEAVKGVEVCEGITLMPEGGCICGWERVLSSCSKTTDYRTAAQCIWRGNSEACREMYVMEAHRFKKHWAAIGSIAQQIYKNHVQLGAFYAIIESTGREAPTPRENQLLCPKFRVMQVLSLNLEFASKMMRV